MKPGAPNSTHPPRHHLLPYPRKTPRTFMMKQPLQRLKEPLATWALCKRNQKNQDVPKSAPVLEKVVSKTMVK